MSCVFCVIAEGGSEAAIVLADDQVVAFLDARPVFKGHTLLVPRTHVATLPDLPEVLTNNPFLERQPLATCSFFVLSS